MSSDADEQTPRGWREGRAGPSGFDSPDDLVAFARNYFASDFPNYERVGCPPARELRALVGTDRPPDAELSAHLLGCSECFREFNTALESAPPVQTLSWLGRLKVGLAPQRTPALATAFSLLVGLVGALVWRNYTYAPRPFFGPDEVSSVNAPLAGRPKESVVTPPDVAVPEATPPAESGSTAASPAPAARPSPPPSPARAATPPRDLLAINTVRVNLEDYAAVRGGTDNGGAQAPPVRVSGPRIRLVLRLPEGSSRGDYKVSIVDEQGSPRATSATRSADGKSVTAVLDLRRLPPRRYRLRVVGEGEVPGYYPIIVEGRKPAARLKSR